MTMPGSTTVLPPRAPLDWRGIGTREHVVQFYQDDDFLLTALLEYVGGALEAGEGAVVIATALHRDALARELRACGHDIDDAQRRGQYVALDAAETLGRFMVDGWPDPHAFHRHVTHVIVRQARAYPRVRAFGEMVGLLWSAGRRDAAIRLEEIWNETARAERFALLCAYPMDQFGGSELREPFVRVCDAHARVLPAESYPAAASEADRLRAISGLQQKALSLDREARAREQVEHMLWTREQELTDFLDHAVVGIHQVGPDGRILWANAAEMDLLGYAPREYIGRHITEFHVDRGVINEILAKLERGETLRDQPARLRCKDGSIRHVLIHSNTLRQNGKLVHTRCFTVDVTEQKRLEDALRASLEGQAEANRRKDEFLAMLGHELRNPLAAVRNAIKTAQLATDRRERALGIADRQIDQLTRIVDDLLDVARITQGKIHLQRERLTLAEIIEAAVESTRGLVIERGHRLAVSLPERAVVVEVDAVRLEQVVANLLRNAAKYTPPGGRIDVIGSATADGQAELLVRDNGTGIAPDMLPRIFELFAQVPPELDRSQGGLGIGLTIVRRLVELHGGTVEARSAGIGRGAEFVVRLPLAGERGAVTAEMPADAPLQSARLRILVVEDNVDVAESLAILLEHVGHRVQVAHDGSAALEIAAHAALDAVILDIGLPGMDGYELAERLHALPRCRDTSLIALSGYAHEQAAAHGVTAHFHQYLLKPVSIDALQRALTAVLQARTGSA